MTTTTRVPRAGHRPADTYQVLILRLWREGDPSAPEGPPWRWSVEDPRTGTRRGFPSLAGLASYLEGLTLTAPSSPEGEIR
ncbi:MAG: hypothetical protein MUF10_03510 [Thermoanaerobaculaceae bacterium]|jgi:hypothetical protein|nr:hypothetical protein [Thermoanaerobaculaceae bacterium]